MPEKQALYKNRVAPRCFSPSGYGVTMPGPKPLSNDLKASRRTMRPDRKATSREAAEKRVWALVSRLETELRCLLELEWEAAELAALDGKIARGETQLSAALFFESAHFHPCVLIADGPEGTPISSHLVWLEIIGRGNS